MVKIILMILISFKAMGQTEEISIPKVKGFEIFLEKAIKSKKIENKINKLMIKKVPHRKETIEYYYKLDSTYAQIGIAPPESKNNKESERLKYMYDLFFMEKDKK